MGLHRVKPVDEYFIAGEVLTELVFGVSVTVIFSMREVHLKIYIFICIRTKNIFIRLDILNNSFYSYLRLIYSYPMPTKPRSLYKSTP